MLNNRLIWHIILSGLLTSISMASDCVYETNQITTIPANSLPSGLQEISLKDNPIATIDNNAFNESSTTLQTLTFSAAHFTKIPDAFLYIKSLQNFELYQTNINDWNDNVMKYLGTSLQTLIFTNVTLEIWPEWFQYYSHLSELSIVNCALTYIPDNALNAMANTLASLTLTGNSLTYVPEALSHLNVLESLYIDSNYITDTRWLPASSKLSSLSLNNNRIFNATQLTQSLRPYSVSLPDIDIINNKLTAIPQFSFLTLGSLDLSYNTISDPRAGSLPPGIFELTLEHNLLPFIPRCIAGLKLLTDLSIPSNYIKVIQGTEIPVSVQFLDLGYNLITALTDTSFPENSNLTLLRIFYNPLSVISINAFKNLSRLVQLFIGNTKLIRLPLALSSLTSLNRLDFSGTSVLVCTCEEKILSHLITNLSPHKVDGKCGMMNIYDFFSILSSSCPD